MNSNESYYRSLYKILWSLEHFSPFEKMADYVALRRKDVHAKYLCTLKDRKVTNGFMAVDEVENISEEDFKKRYLYTNTPVVLKGFCKNWGAVQKWSPEYFRDNFADYQFETYTQHRNRGQQVVQYKMKDYIDSLLKGGEDYFRFGTMIHDYPQLKEDLLLDSLKVLNRPLIDFWTHFILFMGPANGNTFTHAAFVNNYFAQIYGRKVWYLFHPRNSEVFQPSVDRAPFFRSAYDFDSMEKIESYLPHMEGYKVEIEAGDVLYIPAFYWHYVENPTISIGASCRVWSAISALQNSKTLSMLTLFASNPSALKGLIDSMRALNFGNFYQNNEEKLGFKSKER